MTDPSQALGYVGMQSAHLGYKSQLCKVVEEDGVESATKIINTSTYNMVPRIIMVGTKGATQADIDELKVAMETKEIKTVRNVAQELGKKKTVTASATTESDADKKKTATTDSELEGAEARNDKPAAESKEKKKKVLSEG